jgi:hypothetical protein
VSEPSSSAELLRDVEACDCEVVDCWGVFCARAGLAVQAIAARHHASVFCVI